jgi:hypothetical protein
MLSSSVRKVTGDSLACVCVGVFVLAHFTISTAQKYCNLESSSKASEALMEETQRRRRRTQLVQFPAHQGPPHANCALNARMASATALAASTCG